jgi:hypothetical protein
VVDDGAMIAAARHRRAFTFIEVLCLLLVLGVGMAGIVGIVLYGMGIASEARGASLGMPTAVSVARDPEPMLDPVVAGDWSTASYDLSSPGACTGETKGHVNGFYVVRTETSLPDDIVATGANGTVYVRSARVDVDVFETFRGALVASFTTRIVRQRGRP